MFGFLKKIFASERMKTILGLVKFLIPVVETVSGKDWNRDGEIGLRKELAALLADLPIELRLLFPDFYLPDGEVDWSKIENLILPFVKKMIAMVLSARRLQLADKVVPASFGILESAVQRAYDETRARPRK